MTKDEVFKEDIKKPYDFKFGDAVVNVFDDMVNRSVPFYGEMQRMIAELAANYVQPGTNVYDLGCSTGTTMIGMNTMIDDSIAFIGVDDSPEMLEKCKQKLQEANFTRKVEYVCEDLNKSVTIKNASVAVLCLTLQFVRPVFRKKLLAQVAEGLVPGGVLILVEKILAEDSAFNRDFIKYYYDYKRRNHYSEMEISQKREMLENVLVPYKLSENVHMLEECGFGHGEVVFKWYNFSTLIAIKK